MFAPLSRPSVVFPYQPDRRWTLGALACLVVGTLVCGGCGSSNSPEDTIQDGGLAAVARLYGEYALQHDGMGPASESDFRQFLQGLPQGQRDAMGIGDLESFLKSPRDNKAYTIVYGVDTKEPSPGNGLEDFPVVAYEQEGRDGKRLVANAFGFVADLAPDEFNRATQ